MVSTEITSLEDDGVTFVGISFVRFANYRLSSFEDRERYQLMSLYFKKQVTLFPQVLCKFP